MSRKRRNLKTSMDILRDTVLRAHASREYLRKMLHDTRIQVDQMQQQLIDLQRQLNTYKNNMLYLERILQSIDNMITNLPEQQ
jgi:hypothetical protein